MELNIVSKPTSLALKELGFDYKCDNWYRVSNDYPELYGRNAKRGGLVPPIKSNIATAVAPTQSLICKWLRDVHGIYIMTKPEQIVTGTVIYKVGVYIQDPTEEFGIRRHTLITGQETFEQAEEAGIIKALEILKESNHGKEL